MRFIDADKLVELCDEMSRNEWNKKVSPISWADAYESFVDDIDEIPTADAVEVTHGEWKKLYDKAPRYVCTACNHLYNNREYKFCPNCGAKMDGKRSENGK